MNALAPAILAWSDGTTAAERLFAQTPRTRFAAIAPSVALPPAPLRPPRRAAGGIREGKVVGTVIKASLRGRFCISHLTGSSVALGAVWDGLLTLATLHSIVVLIASARADARGEKQDATMARWCEDEVVVRGDPFLS
jgi:hypothetical protein